MSSAASVSTGRRAVIDGRLCWPTIFGLAALHVGAAAGAVWMLGHRSTNTLVLATVLYVMCGLSMTAGYHRLFAHRSFRASAPVRWTMLVLGAATFQNSAVSWAADHRAHHADTDGEHDPHAITVVSGMHTSVGCPAGERRRPTSAASPTCGRCAASGCSIAGSPPWRSASAC